MLLTTTLRVPDRPQTREALTLRQNALSPLAVPQTLVSYECREQGWLEVPKAWGLANACDEGVRDIQKDGVVLPTPEKLSVRELRPHQVEAADAIVASLTSRPEGGGCLLQLPCGFGKTVCALEVARRMGTRTLVVVNTAVLAAQWKEVILEKVPGASVGCIRQNTFDVEGRTHVIATLKSLATRQYPWHGCDLCVFDEVHHICAVQMSRAMARAGSRWRLGLSATPERADGLSPFLEWSIGPIVYSMAREAEKDLRAYIIEISGDDKTPARTINMKKGGKTVANSAAMVNLFASISPAASFRQSLAATWVKLCVSKSRRVLVLSDRLSLLSDLRRRLPGVNVGFVVGKAKTAEREEALRDAQVICASYACAAEGMDCPTLDTLLLLTPRAGTASMTQVVADC